MLKYRKMNTIFIRDYNQEGIQFKARGDTGGRSSTGPAARGGLSSKEFADATQ
jgi:hypothetical protein